MTNNTPTLRRAHPFGRATSLTERFAIAICFGALGTMGFGVTSPILPDLADTFGVTRGQIGLVQAAVSVPGVLFSFLIGYLSDRLGRRRVILTALLLFSIFGVAGFFARSFWTLVAVRFLQGIGTSGILGMGVVYVADLYPDQDLTKMMGYNMVGVTMMSMMTPIVSGYAATFGVFRPFLIFLIGIPLLLWATRLPKDAPKESTGSPVRHLGNAVAVMKGKGVFGQWIVVLVATAASVSVLHGIGLTVTPLFLEKEFGVGVSTRGLIVASFQLGMVITSLTIGQIRARWEGTDIITVSFSLMAVGTALAAMAGSPWLVAGALGIAGVGFGAFVPLAQTYMAGVAGTLYRGATVLIWVTFVRSAQVFAPPAGSYLSDASGARSAYWVAAVLMLIIAVAWNPVQRAALKREEGTAT